eukprot:1681870-Prymnesium_polylepis.1
MDITKGYLACQICVGLVHGLPRLDQLVGDDGVAAIAPAEGAGHVGFVRERIFEESVQPAEHNERPRRQTLQHASLLLPQQALLLDNLDSLLDGLSGMVRRLRFEEEDCHSGCGRTRGTEKWAARPQPCSRCSSSRAKRRAHAACTAARSARPARAPHGARVEHRVPQLANAVVSHRPPTIEACRHEAAQQKDDSGDQQVDHVLEAVHPVVEE